MPEDQAVQTAPDDKKTRIKRGKNISSRMMNYFVTHPGQVVTVQELARSLRVSEKQVRDSITATRWSHRGNADHPSQKITIVLRANSWRYDPDPAADSDGQSPDPSSPVKREVTAPQRKIFEEVGPTSDGGYVIEDEDGALYRVKKL